MEDKPDVIRRMLESVNKLDIDFSKFTAVGWVVTLASLALGGSTAYVAYLYVLTINGWAKGAGLAFFLVMVAVTTILFNSLGWLFRRLGIDLVKPKPEQESDRPIR